MLQSKKNKITISILDRLKQQGMPASPVPTPGDEGDFDAELSYEEVEGPNGPEIRSLSGLPMPKKSKKKPVPSSDEEAY